MADMTAHPQAGERAERTRNVPISFLPRIFMKQKTRSSFR